MAQAFVDLEKLVQKIQQQLAPKAEVLHNVRMLGRKSLRPRQIDVLVREKVGQYEIKIIIDCKDYKNRVDVKGVEEFYGLLEDVGAQKGVLVCPAGFSAGVKERAAGYQIDLYSPFDTDAHKWQVSPTIPALCDFRMAGIAFGVACSAPFPFQMGAGFFSENEVFDMAGNQLGTSYQRIVQRWNDAEFANQLGEVGEVKIFGDVDVQTDNGYGRLIPVTLTANILVRQQLFAGQLPVHQISGFKDEMTGQVITNAFTIGLLDPDEISEKWTPVLEESQLQPKPVIKLSGLVW